MGQLNLVYLVPSADLAPFVSSFYRFQADMPAFEDMERADRAQLRFRLSPGGGSYRFSDGVELPCCDRHFLAPTAGAIRSRANGPLDLFGMGLTSAGWAALVALDASLSTNRVLDADRLLGPAAPALAQAMATATEPAAMMALAEAFLRTQLADGRGRSARSFGVQVDAWLSGDPSPDLDALVAITGLSRRQVERRCKALYGAPPKLLARKYRALRAVAALSDGPEAWDRFVAEGFYDQSHLIREFRRFVGLTPRELRSRHSRLVDLTLAGRRSMRGRVAALVSET